MVQMNLTNFITIGLMSVAAWVAIHWLIGVAGLQGKIPGIEVD